jgi:hypothetical protein
MKDYMNNEELGNQPGQGSVETGISNLPPTEANLNAGIDNEKATLIKDLLKKIELLKESVSRAGQKKLAAFAVILDLLISDTKLPNEGVPSSRYENEPTRQFPTPEPPFPPTQVPPTPESIYPPAPEPTAPPSEQS